MESIIKNVLPVLGSALFGGIPAVAVTAASKLAEHFGFDTNTVEGVKNALSGVSPEQLNEAKKLDNDFKIEMQKLTNDLVLAGYTQETELAKIDAGDRDSARKRHVALGGKFPEIFGMIIFGFTAFLVWDILKNGYSESLDPMIAGSLLQAFVSLSIGVCGYFYGTTAGSKAKTDILAGK